MLKSQAPGGKTLLGQQILQQLQRSCVGHDLGRVEEVPAEGGMCGSLQSSQAIPPCVPWPCPEALRL